MPKLPPGCIRRGGALDWLFPQATTIKINIIDKIITEIFMIFFVEIFLNEIAPFQIVACLLNFSDLILFISKSEDGEFALHYAGNVTV